MISNSQWRRALLGGTGSVIALVGLSAAAWAQQQEPQLLERLEINAPDEGAPPDTVQTTTTNQEQLERRMVEDFSDLSRRVDASINFNERTKSVNLRGLSDNRVLTTIDGIRLPWIESPRGDNLGLNTIDFDSLSAVDIVRGADSTRFGSGALGGVVALRTLDPEDLLVGNDRFAAIMKGGYETGDESWKTDLATAARFNDTYLLLQGGFGQGSESDNFGKIGGFGESRTKPNPGDTDEGNFLVKLNQHFAGGHRLGLTGEYFKRDDDFDALTETSPSYQQGSLHEGNTSERQRVSASYDFVSPTGDDLLDEARLTAYWLRQETHETLDGIRLRDGRADIIPGDPFLYGFPFGEYSRDSELRQTSYGLTGDAEKQFDAGEFANTLRFGGDLYRQDTTQYSFGVDNCPDVDWSTIPQFFGPQTCRFLHSNASDMPDVESLFFGAFVDNDIELPGTNITLTPGLRFDWYDHSPQMTAAYADGPNFDGSLPDANSDARLSGKFRAAWQATDSLELSAQWAQAFRAPSALELYSNYGAPGSYARVGNPSLDPETSNGFEIGAEYEAADYSLAANVFNNYYRNFIDEVQIAPPGGEYPIGGIIGYENRARVQIYGVELRGEWNFAPRWRTWGSFAWSEGRDTEEDEYINSIPPLRAILGLGYAADSWGADVSTTLASERDKVSDGGFEAPGYGIVDISGWWEPEALDGLRIQAGVFNAFDEKYWNAIDVPDDVGDAIRDRYTQTGRSFRVSLTQRF